MANLFAERLIGVYARDLEAGNVNALSPEGSPVSRAQRLGQTAVSGDMPAFGTAEIKPAPEDVDPNQYFRL
ncbi:MAG TPA: hypothetical protein VLG16_00395 [Candidatus Saccharimonadales bacterium]|nr:hypothetical protein [Candidatus Saccharimonadales bacterium]